MLRSIAVIAVLMSTAPAVGQSRLCEMPREAAHESTECVRWYARCCMDSTTLSPETDALPLKQRMDFQARACFRVAEDSCAYFDYEQAKAALDARLNR